MTGNWLFLLRFIRQQMNLPVLEKVTKRFWQLMHQMIMQL